MGRRRTSNLPPNVYKRGDVYYIRVWNNGRSVWKKAGTSLNAAQIVLGQMRKAVESEELGLPKKCKTTLKEYKQTYLDWALAHKRSYARDAWCMEQLLVVFGSFRLPEINKVRVDAFMRDRKKHVASATVNRQVALLRRVLSHAVEHGEMDHNPLRGIKLLPEPPARQPVLDLDEEKKLLEKCSPWLARVVRLAINTGCRQKEILGLRWRHVDFDGGELIIEDSKSGESRRIPVHPAVLEELRRRRGTPEGLVLTLPNGESPQSSSVSHAFKDAVRAIGKPDMRFHDLRHVAGSRLLAAGANLPEIADYLGQKTLAIARRYAHTSRTRLKSLVGEVVVSEGGK
jgi:integrase